MMGILDLPTETLDLILDYVELHDLSDLPTLERTCVTFRKSVQAKSPVKLDLKPSSTGQSTEKQPPPLTIESFTPQKRQHNDLVFIQPLLRKNFAPLFDARLRKWYSPPEPGSTDPAQDRETQESYPAISQHQPSYPQQSFQLSTWESLPWTASETSLEIFLRPGASWRNLRITANLQDPTPITRLDIVWLHFGMMGTSMSYSRAMIPTEQTKYGLTMGLYFDLLTDYHRYADGWELCPGKKLWSYDEWKTIVELDLDVDHYVGARALLVDDASCATLIAYASHSCVDDDDWNATPNPWWPETVAAEKRLKVESWEDRGPHPAPREGLVDVLQEWYAICGI